MLHRRFVYTWAAFTCSTASTAHSAAAADRAPALTLPFLTIALQVALSRKSPYIRSAHRVSGLMLANHTSIRHLFNRTISQFDKLFKRNAFVDNYKVGESFNLRGQAVH